VKRILYDNMNICEEYDMKVTVNTMNERVNEEWLLCRAIEEEPSIDILMK